MFLCKFVPFHCSMKNAPRISAKISSYYTDMPQSGLIFFSSADLQLLVCQTEIKYFCDPWKVDITCSQSVKDSWDVYWSRLVMKA